MGPAAGGEADDSSGWVWWLRLFGEWWAGEWGYRSTLLAAAVVACSCGLPSVSEAAFRMQPGSFRVSTSSDQAGAHPDLMTSFGFAQNEAGSVGGLLRNAEVVLPLGFAGYPAAMRTCNPVQLQLEECPMDAQIGTIEVVLRPFAGTYVTILQPLYNMAPPPSETAVYGFVIGEFASGDIVVSVGPDYRVQARTENLISGVEFVRQSLKIWGVPANSSHDAERGSRFECFRINEEPNECTGGGHAANENMVPYLVNPTACGGQSLTAELRGVESWAGEKSRMEETPIGPFTGCASLRFQPTISVAPEQTQAVSPSGYEINLRVPQAEGGEGLATPDLEDTVIRMPAGMVLSPSAGTGLVSCGATQVGLGTEQKVECPRASEIGAVSVITPALSGELRGALYLGGPASGSITGPPFTLYLTFEGHGVLVKIRGTATPDPTTGQVTTVFDENPQLPVSELKLHLNGGSRAMFANPSACVNDEGHPIAYSAEGDLTPWASPFVPDATPSSPPFEVTGCRGPRFAPAFAASTLSNQAGGYSTFRVTFSREDADQYLGGVSVTAPPGLSANLSAVPLCPEPQAAQGTCPAASLIGEETAAAGPGPEPTFIKGGRVYLTGPYHGAPFGLSIDVAERTGPFDLGSGACDCEVVRAGVSVDPRTAQLTIASGALPSMKDGVPFQVKSVDVDVNRPEFTFNPTNCNPMSVSGTLQSTQGAIVHEESHFQATNCAALGFNPSFKAATSGRTSRLGGASLDTKLAYPAKAPFGSQANIAKVRIQLPKQLPSRLTTLQHACPAATFEANPASCPAGATVGVAKVVTPVIPVPLTGPAIFVSHGDEAFPSLVIVLQGDGVTVDLVGTTVIDRRVTTSTFKAVPDVPVGTFELYLPPGPHSALAANGNLCRARSLLMPTELVSQGAGVIHQNTKIAVTGCPKSRRGRRSAHGLYGVGTVRR
jgi:hypothetical protein